MRPLSSLSRSCSSRAPAWPSDGSATRHEAGTIIDLWGPIFFDAAGTTLTYREDTAYIDREMPLSLYTDMYNVILLRRAGLAVWRHVPLP